MLILEVRRVYLPQHATSSSNGGSSNCLGAAPGMPLPEMPLEPPLQAAAHIYAHGGFLGAAYSMVSDPVWAKVCF